MSKNNNSNGKNNGASNANAEQVSVNDLIARLNDLTKQVQAVAVATPTPVPVVKTGKGRGRKPKATTLKVEPKVEKWTTVGKASESVEDAVAFQHRISVQVQKSSEGRTQVHIYSQVCVPADRIRASTTGLDKQKVKTSDGKTVEGFWLNQKNPLIVRGDQKASIAFLTALIEKAL